MMHGRLLSLCTNALMVIRSILGRFNHMIICFKVYTKGLFIIVERYRHKWPTSWIGVSCPKTISVYKTCTMTPLLSNCSNVKISSAFNAKIKYKYLKMSMLIHANTIHPRIFSFKDIIISLIFLNINMYNFIIKIPNIAKYIQCR